MQKNANLNLTTLSTITEPASYTSSGHKSRGVDVAQQVATEVLPPVLTGLVGNEVVLRHVGGLFRIGVVSRAWLTATTRENLPSQQQGIAWNQPKRIFLAKATEQISQPEAGKSGPAGKKAAG